MSGGWDGGIAHVAVEQGDGVGQGGSGRLLLGAGQQSDRATDTLLWTRRHLPDGFTTGIGGMQVDPTAVFGIALPTDKAFGLQAVRQPDHGRWADRGPMLQFDLRHLIALCDHLETGELCAAQAQALLDEPGISRVSHLDMTQGLEDFQSWSASDGFHANHFYRVQIMRQMIIVN